MLNDIKSDHVLFLDIETVPQFENYEELSDRQKKFWDAKSKLISKNTEDSPEQTYDRAAIYGEFGKIVCISSGFIKQQGDKKEFIIKSLHGSDELQILLSFTEIIKRLEQNPGRWFLCAHNGKEFDFPYLCRRMVVNGVSIPSMLDARGKFAKDLQTIDTMELWKFGDYKHFTSLDLLAEIFGIPSPKEIMDGSMVKDVYYKEKDTQKIADYCSKDVITLAQVFLKFKNEPMLSENNIIIM